MMIQIRREQGALSAMGHSVTESMGGERELKRRCLETISHWDNTPDELVFSRLYGLSAGSPSEAAAAPPASIPVRAPQPERITAGVGNRGRERRSR